MAENSVQIQSVLKNMAEVLTPQTGYGVVSRDKEKTDLSFRSSHSRYKWYFLK